MAQFQKEEVREKIISSAVAVFTDKGYTNASIKEIAEHAGVSVGNVYRYFDSKDVLYGAVIEGVYNGVEELMRLVEASEIYQKVNLDNFNEFAVMAQFRPLKDFAELYREEKAVFDMLLTNGVDAHYERTIKRFIDLLTVYFRRFWGQGTAIGLSEIEVSALTNALVFSVIDLLHNIKEDDDETMLRQFVPTLITGYFMAKKKGGFSA